MAQVQYFWVSEHFEWMFSLLTKDSEGNADVFFFPEYFSHKNGRKNSNRTALDRSRWSILIQGGYYQFPFHWGGCSDESICLWCPTPMDTDRSVPWFWNVSAWRRGHLGISPSSLCLVFWYSREENHIHTIIMNHGLIELGDCVCTSLYVQQYLNLYLMCQKCNHLCVSNYFKQFFPPNKQRFFCAKGSV